MSAATDAFLAMLSAALKDATGPERACTQLAVQFDPTRGREPKAAPKKVRLVIVPEGAGSVAGQLGGLGGWLTPDEMIDRILAGMDEAVGGRRRVTQHVLTFSRESIGGPPGLGQVRVVIVPEQLDWTFEKPLGTPGAVGIKHA